MRLTKINKLIKVGFLLGLALVCFTPNLFAQAGCVPGACATGGLTITQRDTGVFNWAIGPQTADATTVNALFYDYAYGNSSCGFDDDLWFKHFPNGRLSTITIPGGTVAPNWQGAGVTGCPGDGAAQPYDATQTVIVAAYDSNNGSGNADNPVYFGIVGFPYFGGFWDGSLVVDGVASTFGVTCAGCSIPQQEIPRLTISAITGTGPWTITLTVPALTGQPSYGGAGHDEYCAGIRIYRSDSTATTSFDVKPADNVEPDDGGTAWIVVDGGAIASLADIADNSHDVVVNDDPGSGVYFFAAAMAAQDQTSKLVRFFTPFVGQSSTNVWAGPGEIDLVSFKATSKEGRSIIGWTTGSEVDTAGFNLLRAERHDGRFVKVNDSLIPSQGSAGVGHAYKISDKNVKIGQQYFYKLQEIETTGNKEEYGTVSVVINAGPHTVRR